MVRKALVGALIKIGSIGVAADDPEELVFRKRIYTISVVFGMVLVMPPYGFVYAHYGENPAAVCQFVTVGVMVVNLLLFGLLKKQYRFFLLWALLVVLFEPFLMTVLLGGFINYNLNVLWSLLCPLGAMVMWRKNRAHLWFAAYLLLVVVIALLKPVLRTSNSVPADVALVIAVSAIITVSVTAFILLSYFVDQRNKYQQKSDRLLLNILPAEIASILRKEDRQIADYYDSASVLFADIIGFTPLSSSMSPDATVDLLNEVFSYFDGLVDKYGVEKIKTIGDCYMVASGVPVRRPDHAEVLARMAVEIRDYTSTHEFMGRKLSFRIGLHSGPLVAGVIGRKKFIYDLWGDTVNTASRMESHGHDGIIQITESTYNLIKDFYHCEWLGEKSIKGKGTMRVWNIASGSP